MSYVVIGVLVLLVFTVVVFHHLQSRDWREERAFLLQAALSKSLPELRASTQPVWQDERPQDDDFAVGM